MVCHAEVLHGADPDVVYDQAPDLCLRTAITAVHQVAMLIPRDGPVLQHIVDLLPDPVIVLAREPVPESFLCGLQLLLHCVYLQLSSGTHLLIQPLQQYRYGPVNIEEITIHPFTLLILPSLSL